MKGSRSKPKIVIQNGIIVTAAETFEADILISGEKIDSVGRNLDTSGAAIIEARDRYIFPGGVDPHTHFDLPMFDTVSSDDHYTGHKAAAFGGTTTVMDFIPQEEKPLEKNVLAWKEKVAQKAAIDYGFHMNITNLNEAVAAEIPGLLKLGITTLKVFTAYNGRLRLQDGEIFRVLRIAKENGMLTMVHAENGDVIDILVAEAIAQGHTTPEWHARTRPDWSAVDAVCRAAAMAAQADAPIYIVHMNAAGEVDQLKYARAKGVRMYGETCPQYLLFSEKELMRPDGAKWVCSPPMRAENDQQSLWQGLADGDLQVIGTDHCPFFYNGSIPIEYEGESVKIPGKELGEKDFTKIPNGLPMVGDRLPVLWSYGVGKGLISPNQFVALTSTNPAKIFGLYPQKGSLNPGADADIVIWNPNRCLNYGIKYSKHRTDYNLFEGWQLMGFPEKVFLRGNMIVDGDIWLGHAGMGNFLFRYPPKQVL